MKRRSRARRPVELADSLPVVLRLRGAARDVRISGAGGVLAIAEPQVDTVTVYR